MTPERYLIELNLAKSRVEQLALLLRGAKTDTARQQIALILMKAQDQVTELREEPVSMGRTTT